MNKFIYDNVFSINESNLLPRENDKSTSINIKVYENIQFSSIRGGNKDFRYTFENCDFIGNIDIYDGNLTFKKCNFKKTINSKRFGRSGYLSFEDCNFEIDFEENRNVNFGSIMFANCKLNNISLRYLGTEGIYFHDTIFKNLKILNIKIIKGIEDFQTGENLPFYVEINSNIKTGNIEIDGISNLENLHIGDTRNKGNFGNIGIRNVNFLSGDNHSYIINDSKIKKLDIRYCSNFSNKLILQNLEIGNFYVKNTDLGKTTFNGVDLKEMYLENVTLNDCIFNGVDFPRDYRLLNGSLSNKKLRDTYRQLKHVMDNNSNHIEANKFFEMEMFYYMEYLGEEKIFKKGWWNNLKNDFFSGNFAKLVSEKISLKLGYFFSEFGNNWILPIFLIISLSFLVVDIFYLLDNYKTSYDYHINLINNISNDYSLNNILTQITGYLLGLFIIVLILIFFLRYLPMILIIGFSLYVQIYEGYPIIKNFIEFLYPFHGLFDYEYLNKLSTLKLGIFILYKVVYTILIWHLVVALKRTTKR